MTTLTEAPAELDTLRATGLTELLPATALRFTALVGIAAGITAEELRTRSACTAREAADGQLADEVERLIACGVTKEVARRALADDGDRPRRRYSEEDARREIRAVAEAMLRQEGPAAIGICRQIAATAGQRGDAVLRCSFLEFAAAAELLLAEGFDPAAAAARLP